MDAECDILAFKGHCNSLSNMYRKVQLRQKSDKADYRAIVIYDTPLKGIHIVSTVDIHFQWVTKSYILSRVAIL